MAGSTRCWHCNGKLSTMNASKGIPWAYKLAIEPGRDVLVHKCCLEDARRSVLKFTAQPPQVQEIKSPW